MQYNLSSSFSASSSSSSSFAGFAASASAVGVPPGTTDAERDPEADPLAFLPPLGGLGADGGVALPVAAVEASVVAFFDLADVLALGFGVAAVFDFPLEA
jgi:hypothetical protein